MTWHRDSHGLFDYENKNVRRKKLKISQNGYLVRESRDNQDIKYTRKIEPDQERLLSISTNNPTSHKVVELEERELSDENNVWLVVKSLRNIRNAA